MKALSNYSKLIPAVIGLITAALVQFGFPEVAATINSYVVPFLVSIGVYMVPANKPAA